MTIDDMQRRWNPDFDFSLVYYLSGPMTGYENYNYASFAEDAAVLRRTGITIQSPHENPWPDGHETMAVKDLWWYMMEKALSQMDKCQGIILKKGWAQSSGSQSELQIALQRKWPVWYYHNYQLINMNK